ncbi:hypothetical protein WJX74_009019 [Apatococcus lobatus]|uniref:Uncharacterized protein n=1 Tax=Apatococcus lobatus TaxID=904363 RepID=A0AAW1S7M9_9CHLO
MEALLKTPDLDIDCLNGLDLPDFPAKEDDSGNSSTDAGKQPPPPSKGQRYRQNKKAASESLAVRLAELRQAVEAQEAQKKALILKQTKLQSGLLKNPELLPSEDLLDPSGKVQLSEAPPDLQKYALLLQDRSSVLSLRLPGSKNLTITTGELALLPTSECTRLWKMTVTELTGLLLEARGNPDSPAGQQVVKDLIDWELIIGAKRFHNKPSLRELFSQSPSAMDPAWDPSMMPPMKWDEIGAAMGLTEQQVPRLLQLRRSYLTAVRQLLTKRHALLQQVQQLKENLDEDLVLYLDLTDRCYKRILSRFQKTYLIVLTWPRCPDVMELLNALAASAQEPSTRHDTSAFVTREQMRSFPG